MSYISVELSLKDASRKLDLVSSRRERLIKESRDVISLSARTIVFIHNSELGEARKLSLETRRRLKELTRIAVPDLKRYILVPEQEYVEAMVILSIAMKKKLPSIENLGVSPSSYILGLLDSIGELKRSVYDDIRRNTIHLAEEKFETMESLFALLSPFAVYDNVVQGIRRKIDVARFLIEDTRAAITEETRRSEFMEAITSLSSRLKVPSSIAMDLNPWRSKHQVKPEGELNGDPNGIDDPTR